MKVNETIPENVYQRACGLIEEYQITTARIVKIAEERRCLEDKQKEIFARLRNEIGDRTETTMPVNGKLYRISIESDYVSIHPIPLVTVVPDEEVDRHV